MNPLVSEAYQAGVKDSFYSRAPSPHFMTFKEGRQIKITDLTEEQVKEYTEGYDWNEAHGDKKSYN